MADTPTRVDTFRRRRRLRRVTLLATILTPIATGLAMFLVVTADPAPVSGAGTLTVTNCHDSGAGSLRAEMASATAGDTVNFFVNCPATSPITLASTLDINTSVNISGPGASRLVVSGNNAVQDFSVASGVTATISGITIENGSTSSLNDGQGAGIVSSGTLTLSNSDLVDNDAYIGGGIENSGALTVTNSTLSDNTGSYIGGGIDNVGTLTVNDSTLTGNISGEGGGGMTNFTSATVNDSTISGSVGEYGGGIQNLASLTVTDSTLSGNNATNGGGIYSQYGSLTVTDSTLSGNSADDSGGGIRNVGATLNVTNSTISDNSAGTTGGGIYNDGTATVTTAPCRAILPARAAAGGSSSTLLTHLGVRPCSLPPLWPTAALGRTAPCKRWVGPPPTAAIASTTTDRADSAALRCPTPPLASTRPDLNNGGPTETIALEPGSAAIKHITNAAFCLPTDQRGYSVTVPCDIGAYDTSAVPLGFCPPRPSPPVVNRPRPSPPVVKQPPPSKYGH